MKIENKTQAELPLLESKTKKIVQFVNTVQVKYIQNLASWVIQENRENFLELHRTKRKDPANKEKVREIREYGAYNLEDIQDDPEGSTEVELKGEAEPALQGTAAFIAYARRRGFLRQNQVPAAGLSSG